LATRPHEIIFRESCFCRLSVAVLRVVIRIVMHGERGTSAGSDSAVSTEVSVL